MSAADDLGEFFDRVWKDTEGYVYLPVKGVNQFRKFMMPWPAKREAIINFVLKWSASETEEVFFSPAIYKSRKPLQKEVLGSWVAWVDFDGNFPETWPKEIAPVPSIEVQSSTAVKRHAYWELQEFTSPKQIEDINRALAHALDADMSGWDANQFLRPPHSVNRKYAKPILTKVVKDRLDRTYPLSAFDALPRPKDTIREAVQIDNLPDIEEVLAQATWDDELLDLFRTSGEDMQHQSRDRSGALQRLAYEGAEHGWTDEQIMAVLIDTDDRWGKYTNRPRATREKILVDLINRARAKVGYESKSELSGLAKALGVVKEVEGGEAPKDQVLFSIKELAALPGINEWVVDELLVPRGLGLITGRPGVGKTQLAFQLAADLACGRGAFLQGETPDTPVKVLFMSLEMNMFQLGHIVTPLSERYPDLKQKNLAVYAKGEMLPLDEESGQAYFEALVGKLQPSVVIIDSLSHMARAELTSDTEMKTAFEFLQKARNQYDFGLVIIHHHRKKANDAQSKKRPNDLSDVYGSFYITAAVDFVLDLEERSDDAENGTITLSMLKNRYARIPEPVKVVRNDKLHFDVQVSAVTFISKGDHDDDNETPGLGL